LTGGGIVEIPTRQLYQLGGPSLRGENKNVENIPALLRAKIDRGPSGGEQALCEKKEKEKKICGIREKGYDGIFHKVRPEHTYESKNELQGTIWLG